MLTPQMALRACRFHNQSWLLHTVHNAQLAESTGAEPADTGCPCHTPPPPPQPVLAHNLMGREDLTSHARKKWLQEVEQPHCSHVIRTDIQVRPCAPPSLPWFQVTSSHASLASPNGGGRAQRRGESQMCCGRRVHVCV